MGFCPVTKWYIIVVTWVLVVCLIYIHPWTCGRRASVVYIRQTIRIHVTFTVEPLLINPGLQIEDTIEKTSVIKTKRLVPTGVTNTFSTSERGKPLYCSKKWPEMSGPKVCVTESFHCVQST